MATSKREKTTRVLGTCPVCKDERQMFVVAGERAECGGCGSISAISKVTKKEPVR